MSTSDAVRAMLNVCGKKQIDLASAFGMSKQSMANKFAHDRWSAKDLSSAALFCGCSVVIHCPDGSQIVVKDSSSETENA